MKWRWMALWLGIMLCTVACQKETTTDEPDDLNVEIDEGVDADPSEPTTDGDADKKPE